MESRNAHHYFEKASKYALLADFYKYTNPNLHIHYYHKQLHAIQRALNAERGHTALTGRDHTGRIRLLHAKPDGPNVDIYINGTRILKDFPYKKASDYLTIPAGKYQMDVYPAGDQTSTVASRKIDVEPSKLYTVAVAGIGTDNRLLAFEDQPFVPHGESKFRFIHLSPDAPPVDVAVTHSDVVFEDIPFRKATDYIGVTPMELDLEIRPSGTKDVILPLPNVSLKQDTPYTIYAVGTVEGSAPLEALMMVP
ncbi:DUF4397 domain-containing protein [Bacillus sp. 1P06AnD]|uniref:DUF4397 domain-containing protein n=1 Tax=Bacillus sp. 1P06AnD TaxID=3132208 RepID=UPI0039A03D85